MKKIIYSLLVLAMAAFTFSSCEDVPAPYDMPTKPETPELTTDGTEANPYTVADAKIAATGTNVFVKAFIVGYVPDKALNEAIFGDAASAEKAPTNILIAASADETNVTNCMPIQLPAGAIRTALNLKDNPGNLKQEVILCGNIENYFGATGLKSVAYAKIGAKEFGTKPGGSTTTPDTPSTGKGSASDPYTVAEAIAAIKAGAPTYEVYLTGIISEVDFYNDQYKSLSYYISDNGKSKDIQVYSGKGLNGADFTSKDDLKVGQKVTIKGIIKAFNKNGTDIMEVDKNSTIIKIEGEGTGGEVTPKPEIPDTGDGMTVNSIISGKTSATDLTENSYGTQAVDKNETWYSWKYENVAYSGVKICKANGDFTGCIQVQGNASDASKQGFFFNSSAFSKDIKSIKIVVNGLAKYNDPTVFSVYGGTEAHPTTNKVNGTHTTEKKNENINSFTFVYDFSNVSNKYFTIWNNAIGVLYIEKVIVTLK
ncbi:DUF6359 domain-containing protein [uncultured Prevotella sp.]|uniref:DUF6359 domain-containing protein n=1 Tax=Segatella hominis TaxID=2518605 RepID=UPI00266F6167